MPAHSSDKYDFSHVQFACQFSTCAGIFLSQDEKDFEDTSFCG